MITTSSPGSTRPTRLANSPSVHPQVTVTSVSGSISLPSFAELRSAIAWRSGGIPGIGGYWSDPPLRMDSAAACFTKSGPSQSGNPCPRLIASWAWANAVISAKIVTPKGWSRDETLISEESRGPRSTHPAQYPADGEPGSGRDRLPDPGFQPAHHAEPLPHRGVGDREDLPFRQAHQLDGGVGRVDVYRRDRMLGEGHQEVALRTVLPIAEGVQLDDGLQLGL